MDDKYTFLRDLFPLFFSDPVIIEQLFKKPKLGKRVLGFF